MHPPVRIEDELFATLESPPLANALVDGERCIDYPTLVRWVAVFAQDLESAGVQPGERVAIFLDHTAELVAALYAAWTCGAIAVPVHPSLKTQQIAHILAHSGASVLVSDERKLGLIDAEVHAGVRKVDVTGLEAAQSREPAARREHPGGDTPAAILYTSGSTGRPKGILISHANLLAGARIVSEYLGIAADERILSVLPFSFDYGLNQLLCAVHCGATLVLQRSHFPADILRTLETERITGLAGVPPLWIQLMARPSAVNANLPHLRYITNSGGTFPVELVRKYRERWPHVRIFLMYGLSEAFRSTYLPPEELDARPESMGKPIPETEILVLTQAGKPAAIGEPGELVHRGPTVALGYWNDEDATARAFRPDPDDPSAPRRVVYSGDLVVRDAEGFLCFQGRRDQLIKSYGFRVSPDEVEELLYSSGLVAEALVRGRPDPVAGAAIVAHVVPLEPAGFERRALLEFCREHMPAYMVPKAIEVHDTLPRTASGKLDRKALVG